MGTTLPYAKRRVNDQQRQASMCDMYRNGQTLVEIGEHFSISRERVRQIIVAAGVTRTDGGQHTKSLVRQKRLCHERISRLDARTINTLGCDYKTGRALNEGKFFRQRGSLSEAYITQKHNAEFRSVRWLMTFPQWVQVWKESGHLQERGRTRNSYVMARKRDVGPYSVGNVYITTLAGNVTDYQDELKIRGVVCADGYVRLPERSSNVSTKARNRGLGCGKGWYRLKDASHQRNPYQAYAGRRYLGVFATQQEAEAAYKAACAGLLTAPKAKRQAA